MVCKRETIINKIFLILLIFIFATFCVYLQPVEAKPVKNDAVLVCFSGGREIVRKTVIDGPFADEYKFAHEVKVLDEQGEHQLNFAGGLCMIDRGAVTVKNQPQLSDRLSCYSGGKKVIDFEIYGRETTVDEYLEGRTFVAKARGNAFNFESLHQYLVFGGGACLGEETS